MKYTTKDAFDQWWEWANKSFSDMATVPAEIHQAVMAWSPEDRRDRAKVNEAVRRHQCRTDTHPRHN